VEIMEYRVRSKRSDEWVEKYKGAAITPEMLNIKLGPMPTRVLKPNGKPLCVYLPGVLKAVSDLTYPGFSGIRMTTNNRGYAAGGERVLKPGRKRSAAPPIMSSILGSFDRVGSQQYCRLTAFTAQQVEKWTELLPYFEEVARQFEAHVPERYAAQMVATENTHPDWVIEGTPFTTITVNNTYPTGIHTDRGDLDEGFSTLGVIRRGDIEGGWLTFPQYGVYADMQDGDLILMDAHDWHGNTTIYCGGCGEELRKPNHTCEEGEKEALFYGRPYVSPERVSVVSYFRTNLVECGSLAEEQAERARIQEERAARNLGLVDEDAVASAAVMGIDITEEETE